MPDKEEHRKNSVWVQVTSKESLTFHFSKGAAGDRSKLLKMIQLKPGDARANSFIEYIEREISMLKPQRKLDIETQKTRKSRSVKKAITRLKRKAQKLHGELLSFQEELSSLDTESLLLLRKVWKHSVGLQRNGVSQNICVSDFLADLEKRLVSLCSEINETDRIDFQQGRPAYAALHRFTRSLACGYRNILGKRPTKSRTGAFAKIMRFCIEAAGYKVPVDLFRLIEQAVDHSEKLNTSSK